IARLGRAQGRAPVPVPLPAASRSFLAIRKLRDIHLRQRNADEDIPLLADHFAAGGVLADVGVPLAAYDPAETLMFPADFRAHVPAPKAKWSLWRVFQRCSAPARGHNGEDDYPGLASRSYTDHTRTRSSNRSPNA